MPGGSSAGTREMAGAVTAAEVEPQLLSAAAAAQLDTLESDGRAVAPMDSGPGDNPNSAERLSWSTIIFPAAAACSGEAQEGCLLRASLTARSGLAPKCQVEVWTEGNCAGEQGEELAYCKCSLRLGNPVANVDWVGRSRGRHVHEGVRGKFLAAEAGSDGPFAQISTERAHTVGQTLAQAMLAVAAALCQLFGVTSLRMFVDGTASGPLALYYQRMGFQALGGAAPEACWMAGCPAQLAQLAPEAWLQGLVPCDFHPMRWLCSKLPSSGKLRPQSAQLHLRRIASASRPSSASCGRVGSAGRGRPQSAGAWPGARPNSAVGRFTAAASPCLVRPAPPLASWEPTSKLADPAGRAAGPSPGAAPGLWTDADWKAGTKNAAAGLMAMAALADHGGEDTAKMSSGVAAAVAIVSAATEAEHSVPLAGASGTGGQAAKAKSRLAIPVDEPPPRIPPVLPPGCCQFPVAWPRGASLKVQLAVAPGQRGIGSLRFRAQVALLDSNGVELVGCIAAIPPERGFVRVLWLGRGRSEPAHPTVRGQPQYVTEHGEHLEDGSSSASSVEARGNVTASVALLGALASISKGLGAAKLDLDAADDGSGKLLRYLRGFGFVDAATKRDGKEFEFGSRLEARNSSLAWRCCPLDWAPRLDGLGSKLCAAISVTAPPRRPGSAKDAVEAARATARRRWASEASPKGCRSHGEDAGSPSACGWRQQGVAGTVIPSLDLPRVLAS